MKILVTGGSGRIGRYVVQDLVQAGHDVTSIDISPSDHKYCRNLQVNLTQAGEVYQALALAQAEAVIHLGAWANAGHVPDTRTFGENVQGTFNMFQACADMGIKRIVSASSAQVYGFSTAPPLYLPVDESHPLRPNNSYALSKVVGEETASYFIENKGLTILSFRFMGVRTPAEMPANMQQIAQNPAGDTRLLWTRTDARDAALACRLAVEAKVVASGPYNITGAQVVIKQSTQSLIEAYFGSQTEQRAALPGHTSPMTCARAKLVFAYEARYLWSETTQYPE